jgi:hypothetical protein
VRLCSAAIERFLVSINGKNGVLPNRLLQEILIHCGGALVCT